MKTKLNAILATAILGVVASTSTLADSKSYPGSYCVEVNDSSPEVLYDSFARLRNNANGANTYVCGAIKDGGSVNAMSIHVTKAAGSAGLLSCIGQSRSESGSLGAWTQTIAGNNRLTLGGLSNNPPRGYHFIRCSVPGKTASGARSGINSYFIRED